MNNNNILAGLGGAIVLTILNESLKHLHGDMPRIELVGEEAVQKTASYFGIDIENQDALFGASLVGDLVSNTAYFSLIEGEGNQLWTKAASAGVFAGLGAINIPSKIGLNDEPVTKTNNTKLLTIGYYLAGALATAAIVRIFEKFEKK